MPKQAARLLSYGVRRQRACFDGGFLMVEPAICPRCGGTRIVRILWENSVPWRDKDAIQSGQAILASNEPPENAPVWACLTCEPRWETIHRLAIEREALFDKTVNAVAEQNFDEAYRLKDIRVPIEVRQKELIAELCGGRQAVD